jgi:hypothetical protein
MTMTVNMLDPPAGGTVRHGARPLDASIIYCAFGATKDDRWMTDWVHFRLRDVEALTPGQVLHWNGQDDSRNVGGSMDEFEKAAASTLPAEAV